MSAVLQKLMDDNLQWSKDTFGDQDYAKVKAHHLKKEAAELVEELENPSDDPDALGFEYADNLLLILGSAKDSGFSAISLLDYCNRKMEIVKKRKWGQPDENGVRHHIKE